MSTLRDAAEQARTALNWAADHIPPQLDHCQCPVCLALDALEKALAQQEQATSKESLQVGQEEPVAMRYDYDGHGYLYIDSGSGSDWQTRHKDAEPLYIHPPRREAAAQQKQKPVGHAWDILRAAFEAISAGQGFEDVRATPSSLSAKPALRQTFAGCAGHATTTQRRSCAWQGLTDEEIDAANELRLTRQQFARAIEAALKEKNA